MKRNPPRLLPYHETPFTGVVNTNKRVDMGAPHDATEQNMDKNKWMMGVQSRAKEFQPFFRFHGSETGAVMLPQESERVNALGRSINQPTNMAYKMQSNTIKPRKD